MACKAVQWQSLGCLAAATVYPDFLMLRITEIKLPLDHAPEALQAALLKKLDITANDLVGFTIYRRGFDARKKSDIQLVYTLDAEVKNEASLIQQFAADPRVNPAPDMTYRYVVQAPTELKTRPVVIGMGPCGFMAALLLEIGRAHV